MQIALLGDKNFEEGSLILVNSRLNKSPRLPLVSTGNSGTGPPVVDLDQKHLITYLKDYSVSASS